MGSLAYPNSLSTPLCVRRGSGHRDGLLISRVSTICLPFTVAGFSSFQVIFCSKGLLGGSDIRSVNQMNPDAIRLAYNTELLWESKGTIADSFIVP